MFRFANNGLHSVWERIVRYKKVFLWVSFFLVFANRLLKLNWREEGGNEPETSGENTNPLRTSPEDVERGLSDGQHEPVGATRAADKDTHHTEPESKRSRPEEEDEFASKEYQIESTDELYCDYDSTWETDPNEESPLRRRRRNFKYYKFSRFEHAARDMQNYRRDYPHDKPNLNFYLGNTPSVPDGLYITDFHEKWHGEYDRLESVHTFIQWLFPLQEPGVNNEASTLTKQEIQDFCDNDTAKENLLKSYKLMLDFYGIKLCDEKTGEVGKADHWKDRFNNLNSHRHNSLRITRILKCLGNLGYSHYQAPLVRFFLEETLVNEQLPDIRDSILSYFMFAVLNKRQRRHLIKFAYLNYEPKDEFVWCPKKIQMLWSEQFELTKKEALDSPESQEIPIPESVAQEKENQSADTAFVLGSNAE